MRQPHPSRRGWSVRLGAVLAGLLAAGSIAVINQWPASAASAVSVNAGTTYQSIDGFGVSEAFGQANSIRNLAAGPRQQALDLLFSTSNGAGFSILRSLIPSDSGSIEPTSPGSPSATPRYVWTGDDAQDQGQLWLAKQAKTYGVAKFYSDAWSAPGYMKTNGSESNGGSLCGTPGASCSSGDWRQAYANYLVQHARYWSAAGVTPYAVAFDNEPSLTTSYSSMLVNPSQAASFLSVFAPTMAASGLSTKVSCCETLGFNLLPSYVSAVGSNAAMFTSHGYSNAPTTPVSTGGRPVWESEWSINGNNWTNVWDSTSEASGITWAQNIHNGLAGANLNAFLYWWGVSSTSHDSSLIGLSGSTLTPSKRYYALASYSRFIRPGAVRIAATGADSNLKTSAYRNPDGSVIIVTLNTGSSAIATSYALANTGFTGGTVTPYLTNNSSNIAAQTGIGLAGGAFSATIPARSLVSYVVKGGSGPSASPSHSASPTPSATGTCSVSLQDGTRWSDRFNTQVNVTGASTWTVVLALTSAQTVSSTWNSTYTWNSSTHQVTMHSNGNGNAAGITILANGDFTRPQVRSCTAG